MERELLLLCLLRSDQMHGYQLNEFIDSHLGIIVNLKKPTAYRLLNKMADAGWITCTEEREGNRPPRRVFTITPAGEAAFQQLLRENLVDYRLIASPGNVGLLFLHAIPSREAVELLKTRRTVVESMLDQVRSHDVHDEALSLAVLNQLRHLTAELEWVDDVILRLETPRDYLPAQGRADSVAEPQASDG